MAFDGPCFPMMSPERLKELADAEDEALAGSDGILACSPEIWELMNTVHIVLVYDPYAAVTRVNSIHWDIGDAEIAMDALSKAGHHVHLDKGVFRPQTAIESKKFGELMEQENRVFCGESESFFLDAQK